MYAVRASVRSFKTQIMYAIRASVRTFKTQSQAMYVVRASVRSFKTQTMYTVRASVRQWVPVLVIAQNGCLWEYSDEVFISR